ncbi:MAG: flavodoxin domain-containing protein [Bacteroidales bacterium]|nr:flavodoxin domain-containing protein [Bacteroidales bacterium]MDD3989500.1 flavodoxin domain-containing protein [Bacteroidales bacterium]
MEKRDFLKTSLAAIGMFFISKPVWPLDFFPTTSDSEWAILYSTWCGTSRDASIWISEGMDGIANVFDVRENPDLSKYKYIIVGGSIRSGETSKELQVYLTKHKETLKGKVKGLFAVCGNMRQPITSEQYTIFFDNHLAKLTGVTNVPSKVFLGRITWGLMEPETRKQMQSFPNMEEYDNLKRSDCMDFGREILKSIKF